MILLASLESPSNSFATTQFRFGGFYSSGTRYRPEPFLFIIKILKYWRNDIYRQLINSIYSLGADVRETPDSHVWVGWRLWDRQWFDVPDFLAVLANGSVWRELSWHGYSVDCHLVPLLLVLVDSLRLVALVQVRVEVKASAIEVISTQNSINHPIHLRQVTKVSMSNGIKHFLQPRPTVVPLSVFHLSAPDVYIINRPAKNEHVFLSNLLCDLNICSVHCSNDESSIHNELHVASSWSLGSSSGDMLTQLSSRNDDLSVRHVIVGHKDHFH